MISRADRIASLEIFASGLSIDVPVLAVPYPRDRASDIRWALVEIGRLREALEPFADYAELSKVDPEWTGIVPLPNNPGILTYRHFTTARSVLETQGAHPLLRPRGRA